MKTASKFLTTALAAVLGVGLGGLPTALFAQDTAAKDPGPITSSVPGPSLTGSNPFDLPSGDSAKAKSKEKAKADKDDKDDKSDIPAPSPKVPDSVKTVIKKLNTATQDVTLEDLNSAREAIVKLDVLIDIEKRLNDLTALRLEREEKNASSLAAALPASALASSGKVQAAAPFPMPDSPLPVAPTPAPVFMPLPVIVPTGPSDVDVVRITGTRGSYSALIKEGEGKTKRVREGDKLSDGAVVEAVSRNGVTVSKDSKRKTFSVENAPHLLSER